MHLVTGASGTLGSRICRRLLARGEGVRALTRSPAKLAGLAEAGAEIVQGDLRKADWIEGALEGVSTLVLSAQSCFPPSLTNHPERTDEAGNRRLLDAAARAGVAHVVFISAAMSDEDPAADGDGATILWLALKRRLERRVEASGLEYTIVRPTVFTETHALTLMAAPLRSRGRVQFFGPASTPLNWVSTEDVADYVVRLIEQKGTGERLHRIGGPERLSRLEVLRTVERRLGIEAKRAHVPVPVMRGMRRAVGPFHPGLRYALDLAIAETAHPEHPGWNPPRLDWTGTTTVETVVERWWREANGRA